MSTLYRSILFVHVLGALSLFIGVAGIVVGAYGMRYATFVKQFRVWSKLVVTTDKAMPVIALSVLLPGLYLTATWGWHTAWANVALVAFVAVVALGPVCIGPRMLRLEKQIHALTDDEALVPDTLSMQAADPFLWRILCVFSTVTLGIVFLMTLKPNLVGSLTALGIAILFGIIAAYRLPQRITNHTLPATHQSAPSESIPPAR